MYPVSNDYLTEILQNDRKTDLYGTITLSSGSVINLTKGDFAEAPSISNQCSSDDNWSLGSVYQGQLKFTFYSNLERYVIYDAIVKLYFALYIEDSGWEEVPLGEYRVTECTRSGLGKLKISALDYMDWLDKKYDGATVVGSPYDILNLISVKCGITLGQTQSDIESLPSGTLIFSLPTKTSVQTYRDMLRDISVCLAGYGYIGRDGKLYLGSFSNESSRTVSADNRGKDTIADYKVAYSAVCCNKNGSVISVGTSEKQLLDLEDNQFLQLGLDETTGLVLTNILNAIKDIEFIPSSLTLLKSDPSIDLGDMVTATGYTAGTATLVPVHKLSWKWNGGHKIEAVGKDPTLGKTKTKDQKALENKLDKIAALENDVLPMQNLSIVAFSSTWSLLSAATVSLADNKKLLFHAAVRVNMTAAGSVRFKYQLNGQDEDFIHECQMPEGLHTVTLFTYIGAPASSLNSFRVFISSPDSSGVVNRLGFNGVLTGPGIIGSDWNGLIECSDEVTPTELGLPIVDLSDTLISIETHQPQKITLSDTVSVSSLGIPVVTLTDNLASLTATTVVYTRVLEDEETIRVTEDGSIRLTEGKA